MNSCYCPCGCTKRLNFETFCRSCAAANWSDHTAMTRHSGARVTAFAKLVDGPGMIAWVATCPHCADGPRRYDLTNAVANGRHLEAVKTAVCCSKPIMVKADTTQARQPRRS